MACVFYPQHVFTAQIKQRWDDQLHLPCWMQREWEFVLLCACSPYPPVPLAIFPYELGMMIWLSDHSSVLTTVAQY